MNSPVCAPRARSRASRWAAIEPLPLVPATVMTANVRGGEPERARHARHALESHVDALRVHRLLQREPLGERAHRGLRGAGGARPQAAAAGSFSSRRSSARDAVAHVAAVDDHVDRAVLEQELAALEALRQRLAHGLLDHARAGEADQRARLGEVQVPEQREARRHAAGGRVGEHGDERQVRLRQARERGGGLGHLEQRVQRLLHARPAAGGEAHERAALLDAVVDAALEALAHHRAHRAAEELEFEGAGDDRQPVQRAGEHDQRIALAGRLLGLRQAVAVALAVAELQRILRRDVGADLLDRCPGRGSAPAARAHPCACDGCTWGTRTGCAPARRGTAPHRRPGT